MKLITADGTLHRMNRSGLDMIEADSLEQVKGLCVYPLVSEEHRESFQNSIQAVFAGESRTLEFRMTGLKGRPLWLYTHNVPLRNEKGEIVLALATTIDITKRKEAEEALRESEAQFMELFRNAADASFIAGIDSGVIVEANEAASRLVLLTHDEIVGLHHSALHPPQTDKYARETFEDHKSETELKVPTHPVEHKVLRSDGVEVPVEVLAAMVTIKGKKCLMGTFRDITERKKAEEKIRQSEAFIRNILDTVDEGFIVIDRDFHIITANRAYCSQVGESCDSVIGRHCYEISHKTSRPCHEEGEECAVLHVFETGEPHIALHKHPDSKGSILYVETKAFPIKDSTGAVTSVIETVNNITEKHLLEEEQLKTQKLEAIGTLAGGIAHDFNNLLQGVFGYISMAKMTLDQKEHSLTMLEQAEKALHMSVNLTTQLLTFSRGGKPVKKNIQLKSVIENSVRFALSGSSVDFRVRFDEDLLAVDADEGQIGQVVQNIVLNADQSMPVGGTIAIAAKNVCAPGEGLPVCLAEGMYIEISVKDSGIGIAEKYIHRLFDPYFTTKEKGSGLGLATSYSIIKNHGGLIDVKSQLGNGSTFFVYLPAVETERERVETVPAAADACRKGRVLVMDDEELIRNIAGIMLKALGHEAEFAENGEEAIAKYREALSSGRRFDIVVLDLTVRGGMGGEEVIRELLLLDPEVKAVVSSGYSDSATIAEYKSLGFSACLAKPYEVDALGDILNVLLK
ncbi:MAG: PAS domain S-box protein [Thermodesulfovibrionales bacterium]